MGNNTTVTPEEFRQILARQEQGKHSKRGSFEPQKATISPVASMKLLCRFDDDEIQISCVPLSVNKAWKGQRFKTKEYKIYRQEMLAVLPNDLILPKPPYKIFLTFGFVNGASDIDNPIKSFLDILQKKYKFNDKDIFLMQVKKEVTDKPFIRFKIETI